MGDGRQGGPRLGGRCLRRRHRLSRRILEFVRRNATFAGPYADPVGTVAAKCIDLSPMVLTPREFVGMLDEFTTTQKRALAVLTVIGLVVRRLLPAPLPDPDRRGPP